MSEVLKKVPTDEVVAALYNDLRRRISDIEPNDSMVAPDYADLTLPILVGTRCTHNRGLYKCNTQINSSEAWDSTHWDEVTVGSELDTVNSQVIVSASQPQESNNKLWIKNGSGDEYTVPTYAEHQELSNAIQGAENDIDDLESAVYVGHTTTHYLNPYALHQGMGVYTPDGQTKFYYYQGYQYANVAVYELLKDIEYTVEYVGLIGHLDVYATANSYFAPPASGYGTGVTYTDHLTVSEAGIGTAKITPSADCFLYLQILSNEDGKTSVYYTESAKTPKTDKIEEQVKSITVKVDNIAYKVESDGIILATKYDEGHDIQYTIKKHGTNELPDFLHTYIYENTGDVAVHALNNDNRVVYGDGDWHSPYQIKAVNNIDGDSTASTWFTGGAHGYENATTGASKTARNAGLKFFADGEEILSGAEGFAERIVMVWTNYIQASNTEKEDGTGREVLKESIRMTFMDNVFRSRTEFEPLEDINFLLWYGLQMLFQSGNDRGIRYIGATNRAEYSPSVSSQCGDSTTNTMMIINKDTNMVQELTINPLVDLGKRQYCANNLVKAMFGESYGKGYATIINSQTSMAEGNIYVLEGEYRTYKKNNGLIYP